LASASSFLDNQLSAEEGTHPRTSLGTSDSLRLTTDRFPRLSVRGCELHVDRADGCGRGDGDFGGVHGHSCVLGDDGRGHSSWMLWVLRLFTC